MSNASSPASQFDGNDKSPASFPFEYQSSSFKNPTNPSIIPNPRAHILNNINNPRVRYFKTQLCRKFRLGTCGLGSNCSFAHSVDELRRPESGNNNDDRAFQDSRLCRMFYQGQQCSYGSTCRFLHVRPNGGGGGGGGGVNCRETTTVEVVSSGHGKRKCDEFESKSGFDGIFDGEMNPKLKTQLCIKWEMKGFCPYGHACRFAHGQEELGKLDGYSTSECRPTSATTSNVSTGTLLKKRKESCALNHKFNRNDLHRISRIYADWI